MSTPAFVSASRRKISYSCWPTRSVERASKLFIWNSPWQGAGACAFHCRIESQDEAQAVAGIGDARAPPFVAVHGGSIDRMNASPPPKVNIALQGGGSHGAFTWGVLDRLLEDGRLDFEGLSGASAGAVNAALFAHGWLEGGRDGAREALSGFWHAVGNASGIFGSAPFGPWMALFARTLSPYQFNPANLNPLRSLLANRIDFERLRKASELRLFVSATNVRTNRIRIFSAKEM